MNTNPTDRALTVAEAASAIAAYCRAMEKNRREPKFSDLPRVLELRAGVLAGQKPAGTPDAFAELIASGRAEAKKVHEAQAWLGNHDDGDTDPLQEAQADLIATESVITALTDSLEALHAKPVVDEAAFERAASAVEGHHVTGDAFLRRFLAAYLAALQSTPPVVSPYERAAQIAETFRPRGENAKHFVDQLVCDIAAAIRREANNA